MAISIKGVVVANDDKYIYDWFGMDAVCPKDVVAQLKKAKGKAVTVEINSGGGDVFAGSEIYTTLNDYSGKVEIKIVGIAASIASVIAMAGNVVKISPTAQIMIHNVWSMSCGDYKAHLHESEFLENYNKSISNAYRLKTGMENEELLALMEKETWLTAQQAKEKGFVDTIMFDKKNKLAASHIKSGLLPEEVLNKMKNQLNEKDGRTAKADAFNNRLRLLKIKGEMY